MPNAINFLSNNIEWWHSIRVKTNCISSCFLIITTQLMRSDVNISFYWFIVLLLLPHLNIHHKQNSIKASMYKIESKPYKVTLFQLLPVSTSECPNGVADLSKTAGTISGVFIDFSFSTRAHINTFLWSTWNIYWSNKSFTP